jgi:NAD(P)-dependent dehydrogenase (short-subunit alcohol dehydrogenase family)
MTDHAGAHDARYDLEGKVALVTGASRGVGAATAIALASAGCRVACAARSTDASPQRTPGTLDTTLAAIAGAHGPGRALAVPTDLSDSDQVTAMVAATVAAFGRLDILVNNAAVTFVGDLDIPMRRHDLIMEINLRAPLIAIREAAPHMRESGRGGRIINVSSLAALNPIPGLMSYGVSKIALERLTVDAARQLAKDGIAVNCFRIDLPVASEGFVANTPGSDHSSWEPAEVAAEGICWMVCQPASYSGRRESMAGLRQREGIMPSPSGRPQVGTPATEMFDGLASDTESIFR